MHTQILLLFFGWGKLRDPLRGLIHAMCFYLIKNTIFKTFQSRKLLIKSISSIHKIFKKSIYKTFTYISCVQIILYGLQGSENEMSANNFPNTRYPCS